MMIEFFMPMTPPTVTHQEKKINTRGKRPVVYEDAALKAARAKLTSHLAQHKPEAPMTGGIRLVTKWLFPKGNHRAGVYKITRPDTDNLQKLLKDCMTHTGFWVDDAQVCSEIVEKFWAETPGIYIAVQEIGKCE